MAGRIRTVKPEWRTDEKMKAASDEARVLSIALITLSDDYGNGEGSVLMLAGAVWASLPPVEALAKVSRAVRELVDMGYMATYQVCSSDFFHLVNWLRHQKVDKPGKPRYPGPDRADIIDIKSRDNLANESRKARETLVDVPSTDQDQDQDQDQEKGAKKGALPREPREGFASSKEARADLAREIADRVWQRQEEMRQELKTEGIGVRSRALGLTDPSKLELVHRISEALADGCGETGAELNCRHVLDVLEADCRRDGSLRWLDGQHWRADRYTPTLTREPGEPFRSKPTGSSGIASAADILGAGGN